MAKWGAVAACFAAVVILGVGVFQSGLFGNRTDIATLNNGDRIIFVKSDNVGGSLALAVDATTKPLTENEAEALFPGLPVTAHAVFSDNKELIGFEGNIGNAKMVISTTDIPLLDTEIVGIEEISTVNGTSVIAGYFVTDRNSVGAQNIIYYVVEITDNCGSYLCGGNFGNIHLPELQEASKRTAETFCGRTTGQSHEAETGRSRELLREHSQSKA